MAKDNTQVLDQNIPLILCKDNNFEGDENRGKKVQSRKLELNYKLVCVAMYTHKSM